MPKLNKELSEALRLSVKEASFQPHDDMIRYMEPYMAAMAARKELEEEIAHRKLEEERAKYQDWFNATAIDEKNPLRPVKVWDDSVPMGVDTHYDNWWEKPSLWFQRGPLTTSYDTTRYKPNGVGDYIIAFGGAGSGRDSEKGTAFDERYGGRGHVARFTWKQINDALEYVKSLPKGSRLFVTGHSMGGDAAMRFADELKKRGMSIAGMDLRDPVRIDHRISGFFKKALPFVSSQREAPSNVTRGLNAFKPGWIGGFDDFVSLVGNRFNSLKGGNNWSNLPLNNKYTHTDINGLDGTDNFPVDKEWLKQQAETKPVSKATVSRK